MGRRLDSDLASFWPAARTPWHQMNLKRPDLIEYKVVVVVVARSFCDGGENMRNERKGKARRAEDIL